MPHKDPEARRVYLQANRERIVTARRIWYQANKEKIRDYNRVYEATHKEKRRAIEARKDPQVGKAARKRRNAKPEQKAINREQEKRRDKAARAAYKRERRRDGKFSQESEVLKSTRERKHHETLAGRPTPKVCESCGRPPSKRGIVFDHCHQRGHFRGWICNNCNVILGLANDDVQILLQLIAYLQRTKENTSPQLTLSGI
jgi:hypothetical protein